MFGNLGCHVNKFPSGRWGYVGTLPTILAQEIPASTSAVMGGRAHRDANGAIMEWKFPTFETRDEAVAFAAARNVTLCTCC